MVENEIKIKGDFTQALVQEISRPRIYAVNPDMTKTRMTGFQGRPAEQVAQVVLNTAKGNYRKTSGSDINVWDYYKLFGSAFP
jgi:hypothetical protein